MPDHGDAVLVDERADLPGRPPAEPIPRELVEDEGDVLGAHGPDPGKSVFSQATHEVVRPSGKAMPWAS